MEDKEDKPREGRGSAKPTIVEFNLAFFIKII
jgi:hypothetical protein